MAEQQRYEEQVTGLLGSGGGNAFKLREMAGRLGIRKSAYSSFRSVVKRMHREARLVKTRGGKYRLPDAGSGKAGVLRIVSERFGFVIPDDGTTDVFVRVEDARGALDGDKVEVSIRRTGGRKNPEGTVARIVERGRQKLVGTVSRSRYGMSIIPESSRIRTPVLIPKGKENGAREGQVVLVRIDDRQPGAIYGTVTELLGFPGDPGLDLVQVMHEFDLPFDFPEAAVAEAEAIPAAIPPEEITARTDLRDRIIFTIDPESAQDFDDAVSLIPGNNGAVELGVHIADVSYYVRSGSALDKEALARGNSTYLPGRTVPMLPERLSSQLCSLRPDEDRLCMSIFTALDRDGTITGYRIERSIIRSCCRFTYERAQELLDGTGTPPAGSEERTLPVLKGLNELKDVLLAKRLHEGGIDLELPETSFRFDAEGHVTEIVPARRLDSHRLVEECMLTANRVAARHLEKGGGEALYRVHDKPEEEDLERFFGLMTRMDLWKAGRGTPDGNAGIKAFLKKNEGTAMRFAHELLLRSMKRAEYAVKNIGHFGLGFDAYTHYTSPIRRYADLAVHRLLAGEDAGGAGTALSTVARFTSEREKLSADAERRAVKIKNAEFMKSKLGEEFDGYVSGVQNFGLFICLDGILVEGLVHVRDMDDGFYEYDEQAMALTAKRSGRRYRVGDRVRVQVVRSDAAKGEIDFHLMKKLK